MLTINVVTLFPEAFEGPLRVSILGRAAEQGLVRYRVVQLRDYTHDKHRTVDDTPYGGGAGMVMKPEPFFAAVDAIRKDRRVPPRIILTSPQGELLTHALAQELAREPHLIILCGHYEGIDERVRIGLATDEISIGDYVLTGGELPAMVIVEATARFVPGVVGDASSVAADSFVEGLLDYPHYTRPPEFRGLNVPQILLSGNHEAVRRWRRAQQLQRTLVRRPDLLKKEALSEEDRRLLDAADLGID